MQCIFCEIVAGRSKSYRVYEDRDFLAFLNIMPVTKGHSLVIPKKHFQWTDEVPDFGKFFEAAKKVGLALRAALHAHPVYYQTMGFGVPHAHIHVIPRYPDDGQNEIIDWRKARQLPPEEMQGIAARISAAFQRRDA